MLGFVFATLLTLGHVYLCVNMCFNITEGINSSFRFIDGNDAYELLYSYFGLNVDALHLVNGNSNGVILFCIELPTCCMIPLINGLKICMCVYECMCQCGRNDKESLKFVH